MAKPDSLRDIFESTRDFTELRVLGVPELNSFILPLTTTSQLASRISSTRLPVPQSTNLISSYYREIERFVVIPHSEDVESSKNASLYPMMFVCLMEARILTSLSAFYLSLSDNLTILTFFIAYSEPSLILLKRNTVLYAPSPIFILV
jgi:hypothetical protein